MRFFNTAGPVNPAKHYILDPLGRIRRDEVLELIAQEKYFVLHAPRQTGKTTCLLALMTYLNAQDLYRCLYVNVEAAQAARGDVADGMKAILHEIGAGAIRVLGDEFPASAWPKLLAQGNEYTALNSLLTAWAQHSAKPLVILFDEVDSLVGDTLISVLRQLRSGYTQRPAAFPQSVVLCGLRDVRDYRMEQMGQQVITGGSPFNIKAKSLRLGNFDLEEVEMLYRQHTEEAGQEFLPETITLVWELTRGQPWLVNALAYEACFELQTGRDRQQPITAEQIMIAKDNLILRRESHIDQLADKLKEDRVRRVIQAMLISDDFPVGVQEDDIDYVLDLGLISRTPMGVQIANPIYREVVPRHLSAMAQLNMEGRQQPGWYILPDGRLDMSKLLFAFQEFFRENSEAWLERFSYREAGPQLLLQAFLQRIVNGGGRIEREYGLGRMRTDLLVIWPHPAGVQKVALELKVLRKSLEKTIEQGLAQTWEYLDRCGAPDGHLIIFNCGSGVSWEEKIFHRVETVQGKTIEVWGM